LVVVQYADMAAYEKALAVLPKTPMAAGRYGDFKDREED